MKILHVTPSYYPATYYGGPIFSTRAMCAVLARRPGTEVRVLTSDMAGPKLTDRLNVLSFPQRYEDGYDVYITRRSVLPDIAPRLLTQLWTLSGWADGVLLTGTYSFPTLPTLLVCKLRGKPLVWSPRGALQASHEWRGARRQFLKRTWERLCTLCKPRKCVLHVTADVEREASLARLPRFDAEIIQNGIDVPKELPPRVWKPDGRLRLMFISRVDPKKGLETLIDAMAKLHADATLDIYGRGEPAYVAALEQQAVRLGIRDRITFRGHVDGKAKEAAFANADVFVFPTHSENFGMVVVEALAYGVPVIVSHGAPWPRLDNEGCGRWIERTPDAFARAIEEMNSIDLEIAGGKGRAWMQREFNWNELGAQMHALFTRLIA